MRKGLLIPDNLPIIFAKGTLRWGKGMAYGTGPPTILFSRKQGRRTRRATMKSFAPLLVCAACLAGMPATAGTLAAPDNPIVLAGAKFCVGPACVGRDRDRER